MPRSLPVSLVPACVCGHTGPLSVFCVFRPWMLAGGLLFEKLPWGSRSGARRAPGGRWLLSKVLTGVSLRVSLLPSTRAWFVPRSSAGPSLGPQLAPIPFLSGSSLARTFPRAPRVTDSGPTLREGTSWHPLGWAGTSQEVASFSHPRFPPRSPSPSLKAALRGPQCRHYPYYTDGGVVEQRGAGTVKVTQQNGRVFSASVLSEPLGGHK